MKRSCPAFGRQACVELRADEFSRPVVAYSLTAYGQTTNPASKHSTDQVKLFATHQYKRAWFSEAEIKAHLERENRP